MLLVEPGTRAIIFDKFRGIQDGVIGEGTHFRIPYVHDPIIMDVRARPRTINSATGTKDLQTVRAIFIALAYNVYWALII
jgi:prohibitin 1